MEDLENLELEIVLMSEIMYHPHVVRLVDTFEEEFNFYVVMEKVNGGELLDRLAEKEYYNEKEARDACIILFDTMNYCHQRKIAHRDLKPENLLLEVSRFEKDGGSIVWSYRELQASPCD